MHFGNDAADPDAIMDILDRRYGITEERDFNSNVAKKWYGENYHKNNTTRTRTMIQRYVHKNPEDPDTFNKVTIGGWLELVRRSPAILQTYIAGQISLRKRVVGERFWRRVEKMKRGDPERYRSIDSVVLGVESDHPGHLILTDESRDFFKLDELMANREAMLQEMEIEKEIEAGVGIEEVKRDGGQDLIDSNGKRVQEDHRNWR